ncbi:SDR family NAD(P)-dependent oxidoreductase [Acidovorax sp. Root219]|uniref:SDR family NAD(P)-dependent oxidoreductase n=1 Tax=Acidovorax sp. Root219 TaxID=1736493 RepID=UPI00070CEC94|nr:SDR family NAD(P)-dependent oxidoreductase [Acidovorax sp. Root219]KRC28765.1 shikimate dehydrogenase [Acidovorax sp. Root219]
MNEMNIFGAKTTAEEVLAGFDLKGKSFLVTGATSGIGRETARALMTHGANVIGTAKDASKAGEATAQIRQAAALGGGIWELIDLDLSSLANVRLAAEKLVKDGRKFDAIVANAGVMAPPFGRTADGFELQFGINHIGHFVFVNSIEPLLIDGGRLVVLSSQAHRGADVDLVDPNFDDHPYNTWTAYSQSKTANALFAVEFDKRHRARGVRAASVMPGNSLTNLPQYLSQETLQGLFATVGKARADAGLPPPELKEIPQAAATSVWAAVVANKDEIGGRYLEDCAVATVVDMVNPFADGVRSYALDSAKAAQLWARTEELVRAAA